MKNLLFVLVLLFAGSTLAQNWGQIPVDVPPRKEDHMWRSRVLTRVDLTAKVNQPLAGVEYQLGLGVYNKSTDGNYRNRDGMILAILRAYLSSKGTADAFPAYNPDTLDREIDMDKVKGMLWERSDKYYEKIEKELAEREASGGVMKDDEGAGEGDGGGDDGGFGLGDDDLGGDFGDFGGDDFGGFDLGDDDLGGGGDVISDPGSGGGNDDKATDKSGFSLSALQKEGLGTYYPTFEIIEDHIFDKNKSSMYYDKKYIIVRHYQEKASGTENIPLCAFRYEDVKNILVNCQWKNPQNDAEERNALEILDTRNFRGTILNIRGEELASLELADKRRNQMIEYEHHLWEY